MKLRMILLSLFAVSCAESAPTTDRLTQLNEQLWSAPKEQLASLAQERAALMNKLFEEQPSLAWEKSLLPDEIKGLTSREPSLAPLLESYEELQGEIEIFVQDSISGEELPAEISLQTRAERLQLHLKEQPVELISGASVSLSGIVAPNRRHAAAQGITTYALPGGVINKTGDQKTAVILVNAPSGTPTLTAEEANSIFFDDTLRSLDGFWQESSYGLTSASGDVFGWYTLSKMYSCSAQDQSALVTDTIAAADPDIYFPQYDRLFIIWYATPETGCAIIGNSSVGPLNITSPGDGQFRASVSKLIEFYANNHDAAVGYVAHEMGHGLGLSHANAIDFGVEALGANLNPGTIISYGDPYSTMGNTPGFHGQYNTTHKLFLGWLAAEQVLTVESAGDYLLSPHETLSGAGAKALKIRRQAGVDEWLWVELRQPLGVYDATLNSEAFDGVLVYQQKGPILSIPATRLLDLNPETTTTLDASLNLGQSWFDAHTGLTLSVSSSGSDVMVNVSYNAPTCISNKQTAMLTPAMGAAIAGQANTYQYTLTVTNNDTLACPASTFALSTTISGWSYVFGVPSLTLAPGESASTSVSVTTPSTITAGLDQVVQTRATRWGSSYDYSNAVLVFGSAAPTHYTTLSAPSASLNTPVTITARVKKLSNNANVSGATVKLIIRNPDGKTWGPSLSGVTNSSGQVNFTYTPTQPGTHHAIVNAQSAGTTSVSPGIAINVQ